MGPSAVNYRLIQEAGEVSFSRTAKDQPLHCRIGPIGCISFNLPKKLRYAIRFVINILMLLPTQDH
jgi:hypothetical protein